MKKAFCSLCIAAFALFSNAAHAGIPTVNIPDIILQVVSWMGQYGQEAEQIASQAQQIQQYAQQIQQFEQQINQYKQQYESLTGVRGFGDILNQLVLRDVVPQDVSNVYSSIQTGGVSGMTSAAKSIRNQLKIYSCDKQGGQNAATCEAMLSKAAQDKAYSQNALTLTSQRQENIQSLQNQINTTQDPKAIAELQARIETESAQVQNDQVRINALKLEQDNADRLLAQQVRERRMAALSVRRDTSINFQLPNF